MENWTIGDVVRACRGRLLQGWRDWKIRGISTDSRTLLPGELFVALPGERFDGHEFIGQALARKAIGVVVKEGWTGRTAGREFARIEVEDTICALGMMAGAYRSHYFLPVVAITGSCGKTITKELTASVLSTQKRVLKNPGSFNNHIGLPLTLFNLSVNHEVAVVELGASRVGEIRYLSQICQPTIGVITNIGDAHLGYFGSRQEITRAKGELLEFIPEEGHTLLNADDSQTKELRSRCRAKVITFGINQNADVKATRVEFQGRKGMYFCINEEVDIHLPLPGIHSVYNALAAAAVARILGYQWDSIKSGLEKTGSAVSLRTEISYLLEGIILINDAYNANPQSMQASLEVLDQLADGRKIAVLGDMLELGPEEIKAHYQLGKLVASKKIDYFFAVGERSAICAQAARKEGMKNDRVISCQSNKQALKMLIPVIRPGDTILVKGSRRMRMEEITSELQGYLQKNPLISLTDASAGKTNID